MRTFCLLSLLGPLSLTGAIPPPLPNLNLTIHPSNTFQTIQGFGLGLSPSNPGALLELPRPHRDDVLSLLFANTNTASGAGFSIFRLELDSSSGSPNPGHSVAKWGGPEVRVAQELTRRFGAGMKFYASAAAGIGLGEGERGSRVSEYAGDLARSVREYRNRGIPLGWLGLVDGKRRQALAVAEELREALDGIGLGQVSFGCCEDRGWGDVAGVMAESRGAGLGMVTTWAGRAVTSTTPATEEPRHAALPVWVTGKRTAAGGTGMSEAWYQNGDEGEGLEAALDIHYALTAGNVSAYIHRIGISGAREEAPLIWIPRVTSSAAVPYTVASAYWAAAHFSKFIRPGARRIEIEQHSDTDEMTIRSSAFLHERGDAVAQVINNGDQAVTARVSIPGLIKGKEECTVDSWVTDNERKLVQTAHATVLLRSGWFDTGLPSRSLTTMMIRCN